MRLKNFSKDPFKITHNFLCVQSALNIIFMVLIIVMLWGMLRTKGQISVIMDGTDKAITSSIAIAKQSTNVSRSLRDLKVQLDILEAMQQQIIARSPELFKQHRQMFDMVELEIRLKIEKEIKKIKEEIEKNKTETKNLFPKSGGLKLELDFSGEYPI